VHVWRQTNASTSLTKNIMANHTLLWTSLKKLIPVRFASTLDDLDDPDAASKTAEERRKTFFCPACSKSLNNAIKMSCK
jgi:hypothetical protein